MHLEVDEGRDLCSPPPPWGLLGAGCLAQWAEWGRSREGPASAQGGFSALTGLQASGGSTPRAGSGTPPPRLPSPLLHSRYEHAPLGPPPRRLGTTGRKSPSWESGQKMEGSWARGDPLPMLGLPSSHSSSGSPIYRSVRAPLSESRYGHRCCPQDVTHSAVRALWQLQTPGPGWGHLKRLRVHTLDPTEVFPWSCRRPHWVGTILYFWPQGALTLCEGLTHKA